MQKDLVFEMPNIQVVPVEANRHKFRGTLNTLVYINKVRRNLGSTGLVSEADLPKDEHFSH